MEKMLDMMQLGEFKLQEVTRKVHAGNPACWWCCTPAC